MDALAVLRDDSWFGDVDFAKVAICPIPVAHGVASVGLSFDLADRRSFVLLPAAKGFRGSHEDDGQSVTSSINNLQGATVNGENRTTLASGAILRNVEVIPFNLRTELTCRDRIVIDFILAHLGLERRRVYRSIRNGVPEEFQGTLPDWKALDFAKLSSLDAPPYKELSFRLKKRGVHFPFSRQYYEELILRLGMRGSRRHQRGECSL